MGGYQSEKYTPLETSTPHTLISSQPAGTACQPPPRSSSAGGRPGRTLAAPGLCWLGPCQTCSPRTDQSPSASSACRTLPHASPETGKPWQHPLNVTQKHAQKLHELKSDHCTYYQALGYSRCYKAPGYSRCYEAPGYSRCYKATGYSPRYKATGYSRCYKAPGYSRARCYQALGHSRCCLSHLPEKHMYPRAYMITHYMRKH